MKNKTVLLFIIVTIILSLCSCNSNSSNDNTQKTSTPKATPTKEKSSDEKLYDKLFDDNTFVSVKIDIDEEEIAKIQKDFITYSAKHAKSPIYRKAKKVTFTIGDKTYDLEDVGVRMKGNTSRQSFYNSDTGIENIIHLKLSFDETFDNTTYYKDDAIKWTNKDDKEARKKRTFATLSSIDLKWNRGYDSTYIRENYCYKMFRDFGVYAPLVSPAVVNVNNKNWGVFNLYEPVDKTFIERNINKDEQGGDLYKAAWTNEPAAYLTTSTYGIIDSETSTKYNYDLKTNKKTSKHEAMQNLLNNINTSTVNKKAFDNVIDASYWVNFAAVGYFAGSPDNLKNNYNNHYIYFTKGSNKAIFIPYDYDTALGSCSDWNPSNSAMTDVDPFSTTTIVTGNQQLNPIYIYSIFKEKGFYYKEYCSALKNVAESKWLKYETFKELYSKTEKLYSSYTKADIDFKNQNKSRVDFKLDTDYSSGDNMSLNEYMTKILANYKKYSNQQK